MISDYFSLSRINVGRAIISGLTGLSLMGLVGCESYYPNEQPLAENPNLFCSWDHHYRGCGKYSVCYDGEQISVRKINSDGIHKVIGTGLAREKEIIREVEISWKDREEALKGLEACAKLSEPKVEEKKDGCGK